jgi:hypothetical protein
MDYYKISLSIAAMKAALTALTAGGGGGGSGSVSHVFVVNDLAGEGGNHVVSTQAKAMAVPVTEPSDRIIYGSDPETRDTGAPYDVVGAKVCVGDTVFLVVIGDCGCVSDVMQAHSDKAAAEAGKTCIEAMPEINGWSAWVEEHKVE